MVLPLTTLSSHIYRVCIAHFAQYLIVESPTWCRVPALTRGPALSRIRCCHSIWHVLPFPGPPTLHRVRPVNQRIHARVGHGHQEQPVLDGPIDLDGTLAIKHVPI